jgi:RNase P protein component
LRALVLPYVVELKKGCYIFVAKPAILELDFLKMQNIFFNTLKKAKVL